MNIKKVKKILFDKLSKLSTKILITYQITKDYLYSFTISDEYIVKFHPYNKEAKEISNNIIKQIESVMPELKTHLIGSTGLEIFGEKDVDLVVECSHKEFNRYLPIFIKLFGKPNKKRNKFIEWNFKKSGYTIELVLIDPKTIAFKNQIKLFKELKEDEKLLEEYKDVKKKLNGTTNKIYVRKRMMFFNKILFR